MNDNTEREHCGGVNCPFEYSCVDSCMYPKTEEYCRECQHPHVNERLRKEVAELRKENERLSALSSEHEKEKHEIYASEAFYEMEIKRLTEENRELRMLLNDARQIESDTSRIYRNLLQKWIDLNTPPLRHFEAKLIAECESALSGTKETE